MQETTQQWDTNELHLWCKRGALGKLQNICTWILRSPQRREKFEDRAHTLHPDVSAVTPLVGYITRLWMLIAE